MTIKNVLKFIGSSAVAYAGVSGVNIATTYVVQAANKCATPYVAKAVINATGHYLPGLATAAVTLCAAKFAFVDHEEATVKIIGFGAESE